MFSDEAQLLKRARAGDPAAAEELYVKFLKQSRAIASLLRRALPNLDDREEMLDEIYLQLVSSANIFRGEARLSTYIYQIARITVFQKYRRENTLKRGKIYRTLVDPSNLMAGGHSDPEYIYSMKEARAILKGMIDRLPETYREVLRLRVLQDMSYDEIAKTLSLPINTVSTKIHKGKKLLALILKDQGVKEVFDF
jgi:RNA polymerase sigma-70 factor (ECF subfamily)